MARGWHPRPRPEPIGATKATMRHLGLEKNSIPTARKRVASASNWPTARRLFLAAVTIVTGAVVGLILAVPNAGAQVASEPRLTAVAVMPGNDFENYALDRDGTPTGFAKDAIDQIAAAPTFR